MITKAQQAQVLKDLDNIASLAYPLIDFADTGISGKANEIESLVCSIEDVLRRGWGISEAQHDAITGRNQG